MSRVVCVCGNGCGMVNCVLVDQLVSPGSQLGDGRRHDLGCPQQLCIFCPLLFRTLLGESKL